MNLLPLCVLLFALQGAQDPSNPPAPSDGEPQRPQQGEAAAERPERDPGNPSRPGPAISESETEPVTDSVPFDKRDHEKYRQEPAAEEWHHWTLIFFTAVLAGATIALVLATNGLRKAASKQNRILNKRHDLAEEEYRLNRTIFYTENRPRLRVRKFSVHPLDGMANRTVQMKYLGAVGQEQLSATYTVTNIGRTKATVVATLFTLQMLSRPNKPINVPWDDTSPNMKFPVGKTRRHLLPEEGPKLVEFLKRIEKGTTDAYIVGGVRYRDTICNEHETAFCYKFNASTRCFERTQDPDYEYED